MIVKLNQQGFGSILLDEKPVDEVVPMEEGDVSVPDLEVVGGESSLTMDGENIEGTDGSEVMPEDGELDMEAGNMESTKDIPADTYGMEGDYMGNIGNEYTGNMMDMGGMYGMEETTAKSDGSIMSSWPFVIGISGLSLAISILLGILLAKKRRKKGFDLYED